jgi:diguanylate cyclase (GGDEF)-like protein
MAGSSRSREIKLATIQELDRIAEAHLQWTHAYHRSLLCGESPDPEVTAPDAHHSCPFGVWYRQLDLSEYQQWTSHLQRIDTLHRQMHESAAHLMLGRSGAAMSAEAYDRFADHAYRFKTGVRALQMKLIKDICLIDHLTGVWNRSSLNQRLSEECDRMLRYGGSCCLCMMDIDHFKMVNDRHGHAIGDRVLQMVAATAQRRLRRFDSIFRYGGEEFLICLPRASLAEAEASMERIRIEIAATEVIVEDGTEIRVTASFGVSEFHSAADMDECIEAADQALFMAKATGRNRVCSF